MSREIKKKNVISKSKWKVKIVSASGKVNEKLKPIADAIRHLMS